MKKHGWLKLSLHSEKRSQQRGISDEMIVTTLKFGRKTHQNGAIYYSIGRKEIQKYQQTYPEIRHMNGLHIVTSMCGNIITIFRNKCFHILRHC